MPSFQYEVLTTFAARVFAMVGPFVVSIITARVLGPEDRGRYFLVLAIAQIGVQIANLGLQSSNTYLVARNPERVGSLVTNSLIVSLTVAPAVTGLIALGVGWPELLGLGTLVRGSLGPVSLLAVLIAPLMLYSLYVSNLALGTGHVQLFNLLTIAYSTLALAIASIVAGVGGGVSLFLLGTAVSVALPSLFGTRGVLAGRSMQGRFDGELFRLGVAYAVKVYLATMFGFVMTRVGLFALQRAASIEEVGQFSVATQLADGLTMLPSTIGILLFPKMLQLDGREQWSTLWRVFWGLGAVMLAILVTVGVLASWIVPSIFGQAFARAGLLTLVLLPSILIYSLITVLSQYLSANGFPKFQVAAWFVGLVAQTCLSFALVGEWGGVGVALSSAISNTLVFALLLIETLRMRNRTS